jgi:hypothetical protein
LGYEDNMAYFTRKCTSDILLRDYYSVCNDFSCAVGGVEKNHGLGVEAEKIVHVLCNGCERNLK